MKFLESSPAFDAIYYFKYKSEVGNYPYLASEKTQYVYRLMYLSEGACGICVDGKSLHLDEGDLLYLLPGTVYRIMPADRDFSMYSLFFSFSTEAERRSEGVRAQYVFAKDYQSAQSARRVHFCDTSALNESTVFKQVHCREILSMTAALSREDKLFEFHANAALSYVLSLLLRQKKQATPPSSSVDPILAYIRANPDADLSPDALSKKFLYHKNYLNSLLKASTGQTLSAYVRRAKIDYAKSLLSEGGVALTDLALLLGYYDYSHFYKAFARETGLTPKEYLARQKGDSE